MRKPVEAKDLIPVPAGILIFKAGLYSRIRLRRPSETKTPALAGEGFPLPELRIQN